jgi:hypothetical protein
MQIEKLRANLKSAINRKSPEIRMSIDDVKRLLDEIDTLKNPEVIKELVVEKSINIDLDGGGFNS